MSKINLLGAIFAVGAGIVILFQAISSMMTAGKIIWENWTILDFVDAEYLSWIDKISFSLGKNILTRLTETPIFIILLSLGILCFVIGILTRKV